MLKSKLFILYLLIAFALFSCHKKKLTEVVEVPLPTVDDKITIGNPEDVSADDGAFDLVKIPYSYQALIPNIDAMTMETHYSKHYLGFANSLNKYVAGKDLEDLSIEDILTKCVSDSISLRNAAGGYYNHSLYFKCLGTKINGQPKDTLSLAITKDFGSFNTFKTEFKNAASRIVGSGWVWLIVDKSGKLVITTTQNLDNPLMPRAEVSGTPLLTMDLWEHAYYLQYQNRKKNYIDAFFKIINWETVEENYNEVLNKVEN
jgi:Fe-Mn family superoxide dismutase